MSDTEIRDVFEKELLDIVRCVAVTPSSQETKPSSSTVTTVVTLSKKQPEWGKELETAPPSLVYIGRAQFQGGWKIRSSIWQNPFSVNKAGTRAEAIRLYREYIIDLLDNRTPLQSEYLKSLESGSSANRKKLASLRENITRAELEKLRGKRLGCWCSPEACHGDVLVELLTK